MLLMDIGGIWEVIKMLFSSLTFLCIFLPLLFVIYFISSDKYRNLILFVFSLVFYAWGEPKYIFLMLLSISVNYVLARLIDKYRKRKKTSRSILLLATLFNISLLVIFKYFNFLIDNVNALLNLNITIRDIALPIGISFYTFQILSYVIDVYRGEVKVQKNIISLGTYISLFPQLIAGPIVRYSTIEKQLTHRTVTFDKFTKGVKRFIVGLGKKVIIANNMAMIADTIFDSSSVSEYSWIIILVSLLAYTFQIYFDFSGYSDMAIGLGHMFGFDFEENFNYPYASFSITDFWRRWHISLSSWFRDYVYIPLGGNRCKKPRWILNLFLVWLLTGLWHGASWNFVLWGLYYFVILLVEKLFLHKLLDKLPKFIRYIYAFVLINIGWLIFRIEDINTLLILFKNLFTLKRGDFYLDLAHNYYLLNYVPYFIFAIIGSFPVVKWFNQKMKNELFKTCLSNILLLAILGLSIIFLINNSYNPFIYFRF